MMIITMGNFQNSKTSILNAKQLLTFSWNICSKMRSFSKLKLSSNYHPTAIRVIIQKKYSTTKRCKKILKQAKTLPDSRLLCHHQETRGMSKYRNAITLTAKRKQSISVLRRYLALNWAVASQSAKSTAAKSHSFD